MPYPPIQPDGDGGHDEGVAEEERRRLGRQVAAEVLKEQVLLGLLLGGAFRSHGRAKDRRRGAGNPEGHGETRVPPRHVSARDPSA